MTPERWHRLEALFLDALLLPADARAAFLDQACAGDAHLRRELESLLAQHEADPDFLEAPLLHQSPQPDEAALLASAPRHIGPYRLIRPLGRGGMGQVYLAVRRDAFTQHVALKLIRKGLDTDDVLRRFQAERQILASLTHPHIARLFDGGTSAEGQPYFVMEYIDGEPITAYCDRRRLSVEARLELFVQVCVAVQHAHQNLVVHRDLKPSNILVTATGQVKLLDFGIAKLLSGELGGLTGPVTQVGRAVLTPAYASPEQVQGGAITTGTDVYSLGVLLYEVLTGRRPYEVEEGSMEEVARVVCEVKPTRPSLAVTQTVGATNEEPSITVQVQRERLRRRLRGDLDTIVLKALQKEPGRRYGSVEQLAEDLRRHLRGLPVVARPDTPAYRAQKFVRRHRWGVSAATALAVVLAMFNVMVVVQSARVERERDKANQVVNVLADLFKSSDPAEAHNDTLTAKALLDRGLERVEQQLRGYPEAEAKMRAVMGQVYASLGYHAVAEQQARRSAALSRAAYGNAHPDVAAAMVLLATTLRLQGRYDEAEPVLHEALVMQRRVLGAEDLVVASTLNELGELLHHQGRLDAADQALREALALQHKHLGATHPEAAVTTIRLATVLGNQGRYEEAIPLAREALGVQRQLLGAQHPDVATTLDVLGGLLDDSGNREAAEPLRRDVLALRRSIYGPSHPAVAKSLHSLGVLLKDSGQYDEAVACLREALVLRRTLFGEQHPDVAFSLYFLAMALREQGAYDTAESLYREALAIRRALHGNEHPEVANILSHLGDLLRVKGEYDAAEPVLRETLALRRRLYDSTHPHVANSLHFLGTLLHEQGNYEAAEPVLTEAITIFRNQLGAEHPYVAAGLYSLGAMLSDKGDMAHAEAALREAIAMQKTPYTAMAETELGILLTDSGKPEQAEPFLRDALATWLAIHGESHEQTAETKVALAACLTALRRYDEAAVLLKEGSAVLEAIGGPALQRAQETLRLLYEVQRTSRQPVGEVTQEVVLSTQD